MQLILTGHLHQPADDNHTHGLVDVVLGLVVSAMVLHVVRVCKETQLCLVQVPAVKQQQIMTNIVDRLSVSALMCVCNDLRVDWECGWQKIQACMALRGALDKSDSTG